MEFKLFDEYITLQSLLKTTGILHSGGAIKGFLEENTVLFNGEPEKRRGKKIRVGDHISLPEHRMDINIIAPSQDEIEQHQEDLLEKARVTAIVKQMNQANKKQTKTSPNRQKKVDKKPIRFPGT